MRPASTQIRLSHITISIVLTLLLLAACEMRLQIPSSSNGHDFPTYEFEATGEDFLISALDEVQAIADWSSSFTNGLGARISDVGLTGKKREAMITGTDTVYIYGEVIPGGYGAVVTERYARPKGLLLITVRKTYGKENGHVVTETKRYASYADHLSDNPQQTNVTELYGLQADTIVTHVLRNGTLQTYTFRLPVVTRVISPQDGSIRVTSRYALNGQIISKTVDGDGNLVQLRRSYGQTNGSTITRTEYPDDSWRQVRTRGEADGTVTRETTSGLPSLGSGIAVPGTTPKPVMSFNAPALPLVPSPNEPGPFQTSGLASGASVVPYPPRPRVFVEIQLHERFFASGLTAPPSNIPRPKITALTAVRSSQLASGQSVSVVTSLHKSPILLVASGVATIPKPPVLRRGFGGAEPGYCSGLQLSPPRPPRPILT